VYVDGEHYRVHGAKRGPEPAHDIAIWIGAAKPRMLRLIGEKGDGWLPSYGRLQEDDLDRGNRTIDDATAAAGRDPREVRRLLNIPPEMANVERRLPLALEHGVSTFILSTDDPGAIAQYGGEVAPTLRESVERERQAIADESRDRAVPLCEVSGGGTGDLLGHSPGPRRAPRRITPQELLGAPGRTRTCASGSGGRHSIL
jgi:alkanesulfonate monooxygenase SsuD/methylene tetrahydromethanopterin reductase-like flavin-dependent oxidoreductase (luciferase family)